MTVEDRDRAGRTPLHYAAIDPPHDLPFIAAQTDPKLAAENERKSNEFKIANTTKLVDEGAEVDAIDDNGSTPLHFAAAGDSVDIVRILLDAGANVNAVNAKGETPLYKAVRNTTGYAAQIVGLLRERGADPTIEMPNGSSALSFVRRSQKPGVVEIFADLL
jgi:ankyrin repeat protein